MYWWAAEGFWDVLYGAIWSSSCAFACYLTSLKLYLFMILGICLRIMCLMPSTWKVQSNEIAKRGRDDAMLASTYPVQGSASEVNHSGADAQVVSCHRYLVISHLFVEKLASRLLYISTIVCMCILRNLKMHTIVAQSRDCTTFRCSEHVQISQVCISQVSNSLMETCEMHMLYTLYTL